MTKRIIAYTNQNGRVCEIVADEKEIIVEETQQEATD
jgi:hypothetical protein